jgi:hypothetical protein
VEGTPRVMAIFALDGRDGAICASEAEKFIKVLGSQLPVAEIPKLT